eukprot:6083643-Amphidinium_carterae.1
MQELRPIFSVVDGRNQTLQKELEGRRGKVSQAPTTEVAMPHDGFQMSSGGQVLLWSQRLIRLAGGWHRSHSTPTSTVDPHLGLMHVIMQVLMDAA